MIILLGIFHDLRGTQLVYPVVEVTQEEHVGKLVGEVELGHVPVLEGPHSLQNVMVVLVPSENEWVSYEQGQVTLHVLIATQKFNLHCCFKGQYNQRVSYLYFRCTHVHPTHYMSTSESKLLIFQMYIPHSELHE